MSGGLTMGACVLAVTGLKAEARIAARVPATVAVASGGDSANIEARIEQAIASADDCRGIISVGIAGALWPGLRPGACVIATDVIDTANAAARYPADPAWTDALAARLEGATRAPIAGADKPLATSAQKRDLYAATGAAAIDMESHVAARLAARRALPFAALRFIADPQERSLPEAALAGMAADGSTDATAVLRSLVKEPAQIAALARVTADTGRAFLALLRSHRRLGAGFGLLDLG